MKYSFIILFIFRSIFSPAQSFEIYRGDTINRTNSIGLKYGRWINFDNHSEIVSEGCYSILNRVDLSGTPKSQILFGSHFVIEEENLKQLYYSVCKDNLFSVPDGYWISYESKYVANENKISYLTYYDAGYEITSRSFKAGSIKEEAKFFINYNDSLRGLNIYRNLDSLTSERRIYKPRFKTESLCYPDDDVSFDQCDFNMIAIFGETDTFNVKLKSNSESNVTVTQIDKSSKNFTVLDSLNNKVEHILIPPMQSMYIKIVFTPDRLLPENEETISFITEKKKYALFIKTYGYDIGPSNIASTNFLSFTKINCDPLKIRFQPITDYNYYFLYDTPLKNQEPESDELFYVNKETSEPILVSWLDDTGGNGLMDISSLKQGVYYLVIKLRTKRYFKTVEIK